MLSEMSSVSALKEESISRNNCDSTCKFKKTTKSAIQLELDVNGLDDEEYFHVSDIDQYQPAKTPSMLCSQTHFKLENWHPQTIFTVIENVLNRCREVSYEYIETDFKWNALYLECSHHCKFEIRIYTDDNMAYTVDMNRLSGEGKCFNKLFSVFKRTLLYNTSLDALDISVSAENQSLSICQTERHIGPINETEVLATLRPIKHMAVCNKYEAQCETSRMLCMLAKRPEIHTYINLFGIVKILVEELLNSRYCQWTRQHAMLALAGLSESECCQDSMISAGILPQLICLAVDSPYDTAEMSRKAARTLANLTANLDNATIVIKELSPKIVIMWMNTVSQFRDKVLKSYSDQAASNFMQAFARNHIKSHLTSTPLDHYKMNKGNRCYPGGVTHLMMAAQAPLQHTPSSSYCRPPLNIQTMPPDYNNDRMSDRNSDMYSHRKSLDLDSATSSSCGVDYNRNRSHSAPLQASAPQVNRMYRSPTSVSSNASTFIYPPLTGHCHLVSEVIIDVETSVLAYSQDGSTALMYAAQAGNLDAVTFLINKGSNTEQQRKDGKTALHLAAAAGNMAVVSYLLDIGSFFSQDKKGMNAFLFAVENQQLNVASFLLDARADLIHSKRHDGCTALQLASAADGNTSSEMAQMLISKGAKEEIDIWSPTDSAIQNW